MAEALIIDLQQPTNTAPEKEETGYLMIMGFIAKPWEERGSFPIPLYRRTYQMTAMMGLDDGRQILNGFVPADEEDVERYGRNTLYENAQVGSIVMPRYENTGWGATYTGPDDELEECGGFIFKDPIFQDGDVEKELAIARNAAGLIVHTTLGGRYEGLQVVHATLDVLQDTDVITYEEFASL